MKIIHHEVQEKLGLRVHTLVELSTIASKYDSEIKGFTGEFVADIKSILSVVNLDLVKGDLFTIVIEGEDEDIAAEKIRDFLNELA